MISTQLPIPYLPLHQDFVETLQDWSERYPDDTAFYYLIDGESNEIRLTYRELDRRARAIAARLQSLGLAGERALLLYPPGLDFVSALFGCFYAGVVAVPAYPPRRNRNMKRIEAISQDSRAKVALAVQDVEERSHGFVEEAPLLDRLEWIATELVPTDLAAAWKRPDVKGDSLAFLQYTSGSTGTPKGVMLTHDNIMHNCSMITHAFEPGPNAIGASWLPMYHDMGLVGGVLNPIYSKIPTVLMSPMAFLQKPYRWLRAITKYGVTISGGPNFAYDICAKKVTQEQLESLDLSSWTLAFNGAEPVRAETLDRFARRFESCGFRREAAYPCYGMAESTLIVTGGNKRHHPLVRSFDAKSLDNREVRPVSSGSEYARDLIGCGRPLPNEKVIVVDPEDRIQLPADRVGEIWISSASVGQGYLNKPRLTEKTFRATLSNNGGTEYLRTGDLGFFRDGELFVAGRLKDLIIVRGVNRYPQDIELTVERTDERLRSGSAAAFAIDVAGRERLIVVCEVERIRKKDWSDVINAVRRSVTSEHEIPPDGVILIRAGSIPKTSSGKIQRHACRNGFLDNSLMIMASYFSWDREVSEELGLAGVSADSKAKRDKADRRAVGTTVGTDEYEVPKEFYRFDQMPEYAQLKAYMRTLESNGLPAPYYPLNNPNGDNASAIDSSLRMDFSSGDYLGMSEDPEVCQSAHRAIEKFGTSVSSGQLATDEKPLSRMLEQEIADFIGVPAAITYLGVPAANESTIGHLFGPGDLILYDSLAHTSIVQGSIQSGARRRSFPHNDWQVLEDMLRELRHQYRRVLVVIEGIYGTDGDYPDLPHFIEVKKLHKTFLMVDEAHSIGTLGPHGRGISEFFEIDPLDVDIWTACLSHAFGSSGGYIAGRRELIEYLQYTDPAFVQSIGLPPPNAAAALASLQLIQEQPERVERCLDRSRLFWRLCRQNGLDTGRCKNTPVIPVIIGSSTDTMRLSGRLFDRGINVQPLLPPTVDEGAARLRFFITSEHSELQIQSAVEAVTEELRKLRPKRPKRATVKLNAEPAREYVAEHSTSAHR